MTSNVAASVRARLTTWAKATNRPFQEVLQHYGLERFLYRLAHTPYQSRFLLKGALLLRVWGVPVSRPTRDIDLLGYVENEIPVLEVIVRGICTVAVEDDGLRFDETTVVGRRITEDADYQGVRVTFTGFLDKARIPMQLDIGFGDVVHPLAEERDYPTMLAQPAPRLRMYPRETVVAEKFEAMVQLGTLNGRMKDFFDIWLLSREFDFSGLELAQAIQKTFVNRRTDLEREPIALTSAFTAAEASQKQWTAFVTRALLDSAPRTLAETGEQLRRFLLPVSEALVSGDPFDMSWRAPGPWGK